MTDSLRDSLRDSLKSSDSLRDSLKSSDSLKDSLRDSLKSSDSLRYSLKSSDSLRYSLKSPRFAQPSLALTFHRVPLLTLQTTPAGTGSVVLWAGRYTPVQVSAARCMGAAILAVDTVQAIAADLILHSIHKIRFF